MNNFHGVGVVKFDFGKAGYSSCNGRSGFYIVPCKVFPPRDLGLTKHASVCDGG